MEPLAALGVASNIVAFVQFAGSILNGTHKLHASTSGASDQTDSLEALFGTLSGFGSKLKLHQQNPSSNSTAGPQPPAAGTPTSSVLVRQLQNLASRCDADCERLLAILRRLNVKTRSGPGWWKSFQVAFLEVMKSSEVTDLRKRIHEYQTSITADIASSEGIGKLGEGIEQMRIAIQTSESRMSSHLATASHNITDVMRRITQLQTQTRLNSLTLDSIKPMLAEVHHLLLNGHILKRQQAVLWDLHYDERPVRYEAIATAHQATFQWVFGHPDPDSFKRDPGDLQVRCRAQTRLVTWLREGDGVFWVSGKPGSGKSTLMKFLVNNHNTNSALGAWGGNRDVITASHYFWAAGSAIQRSSEGLIRSLLFNMLDQCPYLIPTVLPQRWARGVIVSDPRAKASRWTMSELQAAIDLIKVQADLPVQFCFFIDGLDEYSGNHDDLSRLVKALSLVPGIKVCVSSRPWNVFKEHFGADDLSMIYIHDLTLGDIRRYATSELSQETGWLTSKLHGDKKWIIDQITERAQGVFLWVYLVTRQLKEGLVNHDTTSDLRKRLDNIPTDLEEFFKKIIGSVEPFYHDKMAGTLKMALAAEEPLPTAVYAFHDLEYDDEDYYLKESHEYWMPSQFVEFEAPFHRRLNSRCKGLLEIHHKKVDFLHRTVRDFLRTAEMQLFVEKYATRKLCPSFSIFKGYASVIGHNQSVLFAEPLKILRYARDALDDMVGNTDSVCDHLYKLETVFSDNIFDRETFGNTMKLEAFRHAVLEAEISVFISYRMRQDPDYFGHSYLEAYPPALEYVLNPKVAWTPRRLSLLSTLLQNGHDPNEATPGKTISLWAEYLNGLFGTWNSATPDNVFTESKVISSALEQGALLMLLESGADPNPSCGVQITTGAKTEPWEGVLAFATDRSWSCGSFVEFADSVIPVFEIMLSAANLSTACPCLGYDDSMRFGKGCQTIHSPVLVASQPRLPSRRLLAWRYLCSTLQDLSSDVMMLPRSKHQYLTLMAGIIRVFITKARDPTLCEEDIVPHLDVLPPDLRNSVLNVIQRHPRSHEAAGDQAPYNSPNNIPPFRSIYGPRPPSALPNGLFQTPGAASRVGVPQTGPIPNLPQGPGAVPNSWQQHPGS
ncbi:hypothetical protein MFIFM68171_05836 [Madurella fahalii]|uniref:NACHT domain-containing protein n=1 Tax=Madurella fahalii TaxID=1157608 RepID=A0ABQ0GD08_9PEZI